MIRLTRLNRMPMVLNSDLIEHIDVTPDTVITMTNGQILRVLESPDEVVRRIVDFRKQIHGLTPRLEQRAGAALEPASPPDAATNLGAPHG